MTKPLLPMDTTGKVLSRTGAIVGVPLIFIIISVIAAGMTFSDTVTATVVVCFITIVYTLIARHYLTEYTTRRFTELGRDVRAIARQTLPGPVMGWMVAALIAAWFTAQCLAKTTYAVFGSEMFEKYAGELNNSNPWLVVGLAVFLAPISEELLMRGTIYPLLRLSMSVIPSIIITALIFGAIHANIVQFVVTVPLTIISALIYEWTRNIAYCIMMHLIFNTMSLFIAGGWLDQIAEKNAALTVSMAVLSGVIAWMLVQRARSAWTPSNNNIATAGPAGPTENGSVA